MKVICWLLAAIIIELLALAGSCHAGQLNLTWSDGGGETGFTIQRSVGPTTNFVTLATVSSNVNAYIDSAVVAGTQYLYRLNAFNAWGTSSWSNVAGALTPSAPPAPTLLPITVTTAWNGTRIQFYATRGKYIIESRPAGGNWVQAATLTTKKPKALAWLDVGATGRDYRVYKI